MEAKTVRLDEIDIPEGVVPAAMVRSMQNMGQKIRVVLTKDNGRYRVVAGRRRLLALREAGTEAVEADVIDPGDADDVTVIENLVRSPNPGVEAQIFRRKLAEGETVEAMAKRYGISQARIKERLSLTALVPPLFDRLVKGEIAGAAAQRALKLPAPAQEKLASQEKITMKEINIMVREQQYSFLGAIEIPKDERDEGSAVPRFGLAEQLEAVSMRYGTQQRKVLLRAAEILKNGRAAKGGPMA